MKKERLFAAFGSLCLLLTACGMKKNPVADSNSSDEIVTETTTSASSVTTETTTTEAVTTTTSVQHTTGVVSGETTSGTEVTGTAPDPSGGGNPGGNIGSMRFNTPEEALLYTFDTWNRRDAEGLLRALPEKIIQKYEEESELDADGLLDKLNEMFAEQDEDGSGQKIYLKVLGRSSIADAYKGTDDEEEDREQLQDDCDDFTKMLVEDFGYDASKVRFEILSVHVEMTDESEHQEEDVFLPVYYAEDRWIDPDALYFLILALW